MIVLGSEQHAVCGRVRYTGNNLFFKPTVITDRAALHALQEESNSLVSVYWWGIVVSCVRRWYVEAADSQLSLRRKKEPQGHTLFSVYVWLCLCTCMIVTFALKMRKVMFWSPCIYLYACSSHNTKSFKQESHEIWWDDWLLSGDHLIRFWDQSGQRSTSWKGQNLLFTIARSIFIQLACN